MAIVEQVSGKDGLADNVATLMWRYPHPPYTKDNFVLVIQGQLPLVILLGFMLAVLTVTRNVVLEKEKRLKVIYR